MAKIYFDAETDRLWIDGRKDVKQEVAVAQIDTVKLEGLIQAFNALPSPVHIGQSKVDGQDVIHITIGDAKYGTNIVSDSYNKDIAGVPCKINITYTMKAGERLRLDNIQCLFDRIVQTTTAFVEQEFARLEYTEPLRPLVQAIAKIRRGMRYNEQSSKLLDCVDALCSEMGIEICQVVDASSVSSKEA